MSALAIGRGAPAAGSINANAWPIAAPTVRAYARTPSTRSRASRARAAAMPRIAPMTDESWRTEPMRAVTSLSLSVTENRP